MATPSGEAKDGKAFYGYLFTRAKPIPAPTPVLDALLRAIALHIVRCSHRPCPETYADQHLQTTEIGDKSDAHLTPTKLAAFYKTAGHDWDCELSPGLCHTRFRPRLLTLNPSSILR
jgi:hypothetical protein